MPNTLDCKFNTYSYERSSEICQNIFHCSFTLPCGGKLWRVQTLVKWQGKHHWWNKLWRIDHKSSLKQFEDTSAPNLSIRTYVCECMLLVNYVGWLLSFSVKSMIRGYHEYIYSCYRMILYSRWGTGVHKGAGKSRRFVVS